MTRAQCYSQIPIKRTWLVLTMPSYVLPLHDPITTLATTVPMPNSKREHGLRIISQSQMLWSGPVAVKRLISSQLRTIALSIALVLLGCTLHQWYSGSGLPSRSTFVVQRGRVLWWCDQQCRCHGYAPRLPFVGCVVEDHPSSHCVTRLLNIIGH